MKAPGKLRIRLNLAIMFPLFAGLSEGAQLQQVWQASYNHGLINRQHAPVAMVLDSSGQLVVAGSSQNTQSNYDYVTIKYTPSGAELWVRRYDSGAGTNDQLCGLAVDRDGNVCLTGTSVSVKYDAGGTQLWTAPYPGRAVATDTNGNVYVTGFSEVDFATVKLNLAGSNVWVRTYDQIGQEDISQAVAVDNGGNVYVAGRERWICDRIACYPRFAVLKYASGGSQLWATNYPVGQYYATPQTRVSAMVFIGGNVYVTGNLDGGPYPLFATVKIDTDGQILWFYHWSQYNEGVKGIVVDSGGNREYL
jgi:hypothetical protein